MSGVVTDLHKEYYSLLKGYTQNLHYNTKNKFYIPISNLSNPSSLVLYGSEITLDAWYRQMCVQ